jgi:hypothetical protein
LYLTLTKGVFMKKTKLLINTKVIEKLNPCKDRFDNWKRYYEYRSFDLKSFLGLKNITHRDKLWVVLRLVDNDTKIIFALDCCFSAANAASAASASAYASASASAYASVYASASASADAADAASADAADAASADAYANADANASANAAAYAFANAAAYAFADADADAAYASADASANARKNEEFRQIESLLYLI